MMGGHYQNDHGTEQAVKTAHQIWTDLIRGIERKDAEIARLQEDMLVQTRAINRLGAAAEDRNEVDAAREILHQEDLAKKDAEVTSLKAQIKDLLEAYTEDSQPCPFGEAPVHAQIKAYQREYRKNLYESVKDINIINAKSVEIVQLGLEIKLKDLTISRKNNEIGQLKSELKALRNRPPSDAEDKISDLERAVVEAALIGIVKAREQGVSRFDLSYPPIWDAIEALEAALKPKTKKQSLWVWTDGHKSECDYYNDGEGLPDYGTGDWYLVPGKTREVEVSDE